MLYATFKTQVKDNLDFSMERGVKLAWINIRKG